MHLMPRLIRHGENAILLIRLKSQLTLSLQPNPGGVGQFLVTVILQRSEISSYGVDCFFPIRPMAWRVIPITTSDNIRRSMR